MLRKKILESKARQKEMMQKYRKLKVACTARENKNRRQLLHAKQEKVHMALKNSKVLSRFTGCEIKMVQTERNISYGGVKVTSVEP